MSWLKFVLVFLQSLCITCSCCIFEVRDSYGNVVVIVSMKKCLKMQTLDFSQCGIISGGIFLFAFSDIFFGFLFNVYKNQLKL